MKILNKSIDSLLSLTGTVTLSLYSADGHTGHEGPIEGREVRGQGRSLCQDSLVLFQEFLSLFLPAYSPKPPCLMTLVCTVQYAVGVRTVCIVCILCVQSKVNVLVSLCTSLL